VLESFRYKVRGHIPLTNWWLFWQNLDKDANSILDLGCGRGKQMQFINRKKRYFTVGVDLFEPYLDECRREGSYDLVVSSDIRQLEWVEDNSYDVVMCLEVLEHLEKEDGKILIRNMMRIARRQVLVQTPVDSFEWEGLHGNPLNKHLYVWKVEELQEVGFDNIYGMSVKGWGGISGLSRLIPGPLRWFCSTALMMLVGIVMYHKPEWSGAVLCVKKVANNA